MNLDLQLTDSLILNYIEDNFWQDNELITVELSLSFYGQHGTAYLKIDQLDSDWPSYAMTEINGDLAESFNDVLERDDVFEKISKQVKIFKKEFDKQQLDYENEFGQ